MEIQYSSQGVPRKRRSQCRKIDTGNPNAQEVRGEAPPVERKASDEISTADNADAYDDYVYVDYVGLGNLGLGCIPAQEVVMLTHTLRFDAFLRKTRDYLELCIAHLERAF